MTLEFTQEHFDRVILKTTPHHMRIHLHQLDQQCYYQMIHFQNLQAYMMFTNLQAYMTPTKLERRQIQGIA